jgi:hypothetical protein
MDSPARNAAMRKMMFSPLLWAALGLWCVMLPFPDRAAAAPAGQQASAASANADSTTAAAPAEEPRMKSGHAGAPPSPRTGAPPSAGAKGGNSAAPRGSPQVPQRGHSSSSANADRLHALMNAQARGHLIHPGARPLGTRAANAGGLGLRQPGSTVAAAAPALAASKRNAFAARKPTMMPRNSAMGGPHLQNGARLGGTMLGGASRSAAMDGAQVHRKF